MLTIQTATAQLYSRQDIIIYSEFKSLANNTAIYCISEISTNSARITTSQKVYNKLQLYLQRCSISNLSKFVAYLIISRKVYSKLQFYFQVSTSNILNYIVYSIISRKVYNKLQLYFQTSTSNISDYIVYSIISRKAYNESQLYFQVSISNISDYVVYSIISRKAYSELQLYFQVSTSNISDYAAYLLTFYNISKYCENSDNITDSNIYQSIFDCSLETQDDQVVCNKINIFVFFNCTSFYQASYSIC